MAKHLHEIRDPIHVFIRMDDSERIVLNSWPFQRLRFIHQLALTYLLYPGATHRRFEHSLGVMELASRVFDVVTHSGNVTDQIRELLPEMKSPDQLAYWRRVIRMAALCHDLGHLPFSHAAEAELLPAGCSHEDLSAQIIRSDQMQHIWAKMTPPLRADDVVKLALGPGKAKSLAFSTWERILSEIIVGDAFGVDRIDYLLRDSHHAGVAYGRFDHYRLIDTLRILPAAPTDKQTTDSLEPELGVQEGGIHSAEALMLARYFMYSQLYFHPVRRIYDIHLKDFLLATLPTGKFSTRIQHHLQLTDNEVTASILKAARKPKTRGHDPARRILNREHFRLVYERNPNDVKVNPDAGRDIFEGAKKEFGSQHVRFDSYSQRGGAPDFPVQMWDGRVVSSMAFSETLSKLPVLAVDFVFVDPKILDKARAWLEQNRQQLIQPKEVRQ